MKTKSELSRYINHVKTSTKETEYEFINHIKFSLDNKTLKKEKSLTYPKYIIIITTSNILWGASQKKHNSQKKINSHIEIYAKISKYWFYGFT